MDIESEAIKQQNEMDQVMAGALGNIKVFLEPGIKDAFIQIEPLKVTSFQLPEPSDKDPLATQDLMECNVVEPTTVDRWNNNKVVCVNHIKPEDMELLGKTQTDELTGEQYMLLPIDIDILLDPDNLPTPLMVQQNLENLCIGEDKGITIQLDPPELQGREADIQYAKHKFTIPKLNFNFNIILDSESDETKDLQLDKATN
ncbi:uncharacterized protein LOC110184414 [Drosophila serrata]|uniref:uncharacterized protein LOC110184414 n=1 Tax=Drosophila serrata TaxID=7274 RepID=UPI000A1D0BCC|nr:uncharacterized protein LOC110184414 [Drosophila serrata]